MNPTLPSLPALATALLLAGVGPFAAGCGDGGGDCEGRAGTYTIAIGPGTGTCGPEYVLAENRLTFEVEPGTSCGADDLWQVVSSSNECAANWLLLADLDETGVHDATLSLEVDCAGGGGCSHTFEATVTPAP